MLTGYSFLSVRGESSTEDFLGVVVTVTNAIQLSLVKRPHVYFVLENINTGKHTVVIMFTSEVASS